MSHAPGPWTVLDHTKEPPTQEILCIPETGFALECEPFESISDTDRANANLIAAAPDLLEACELLLALVETNESRLGFVSHQGNVARAAIKKARAE